MSAGIPLNATMPSAFNRNLGDLAPPSLTHSNQPSTGTGQRRDLNTLLNAGFESTVSARALISREPVLMSLAQRGSGPSALG